MELVNHKSSLVTVLSQAFLYNIMQSKHFVSTIITLLEMFAKAFILQKTCRVSTLRLVLQKNWGWRACTEYSVLTQRKQNRLDLGYLLSAVLKWSVLLK